jgi:small-conductance mechanosensitive channel
VGNGYGQQAVVGNFVAGLIMLFERPVKPGDWIAVGGTHGYVTKVRVRATEIRTFDRAEVLVPNSEFVSSQVTNMTLRDSFGRLVVPVGVAYGSDVHKVRDILLEIAREHPQVVQGGRVPGPSVLFLAFADSSLNFELRCFIQNVNNKLGALSDINFEIDRRFREAGVEIPFPQRDLHIRSDLPRWPDRPDRGQPPPRKEPEPTPPPKDGEPSLTADA